MKFSKQFIAGTAKDYDTDISTVEYIAWLSEDGEDFYRRMEEFIKEGSY